jgi:hypothetical protein
MKMSLAVFLWSASRSLQKAQCLIYYRQRRTRLLFDPYKMLMEKPIISSNMTSQKILQVDLGARSGNASCAMKTGNKRMLASTALLADSALAFAPKVSAETALKSMLRP